MAMVFRKAVFPSKYIQGENASLELPALLEGFGRSLIIATPSAFTRILPKTEDKLPKETVIEKFNGECCSEEIERLLKLAQSQKFFAVTGIGGGKTIDTAKILADQAGLPVIVMPTIASTDAPCSGCAVVYTKEGTFKEVYYQRRNPEVVLVDTTVIAQAPVRFLVSGMGDALATWFEARSCFQTYSRSECGGISTAAGKAIAQLCLETLYSHGLMAKAACEQQVVTPALERIVEANTLLSGIGFESCGLAAAHAIHNGLTALEETHCYYHGEKVAFGLLAGLQLIDADPAETEQVYDFCESVGLPTTLADIGLEGISKERLYCAAEQACLPGSSIHHEAGAVTPERVLAAMLAADAIGRSRAECCCGH